MAPLRARNVDVVVSDHSIALDFSAKEVWAVIRSFDHYARVELRATASKAELG
jgi:hypothetical protein